MKNAKAQVLVASRLLGIPYDQVALERAVEENPDVIVIDGGSIDSGPHHLGSGTQNIHLKRPNMIGQN